MLAARGLDDAALTGRRPRARPRLDHAVRADRRRAATSRPPTSRSWPAADPVWSCGYDDHELPPVRGGGDQGYAHRLSLRGDVRARRRSLYRELGGRGQHIDVSLHAAANVTTEMASYHWLVAKDTVQRQTGRHATSGADAAVAAALRGRAVRQHRRSAAQRRASTAASCAGCASSATSPSCRKPSSSRWGRSGTTSISRRSGSTTRSPRSSPRAARR